MLAFRVTLVVRVTEFPFRVTVLLRLTLTLRLIETLRLAKA